MKPLESSYSNVPDGDVYKRGSLKKSIISAFEEGGREVREFLLQRQKFMTHAHNSSIQDKKKLDVKKDLHQAQVTAPQACPSEACLSVCQLDRELEAQSSNHCTQDLVVPAAQALQFFHVFSVIIITPETTSLSSFKIILVLFH